MRDAVSPAVANTVDTILYSTVHTKDSILRIKMDSIIPINKTIDTMGFMGSLVRLPVTNNCTVK